MKYQNFSRQEKRENQHNKLVQALAGKGLYIYENNVKADLSLPKATATGVKNLKAGARFQGDDYFLSMVRTGELRLIEVLDTGVPTPMNESKLILDQPETVTVEGTVEQVQINKMKKAKKLKEGSGSPENETPKLLIEQPDGHIQSI